MPKDIRGVLYNDYFVLQNIDIMMETILTSSLSVVITAKINFVIEQAEHREKERGVGFL